LDTLFPRLSALSIIIVGLFIPLLESAHADGVSPGYVLGGPLDAPIRMEVFSDFQCSACRAFYLETVRPILRDYASKGKVCVIYHDFPLVSHAYSREAVRYSHAAHPLGRTKWLAVVDALYEHQSDWAASGDIGTAIAQAISPEDFKQLEQNLRDPLINQAIEQDIALAREKQINATPTFFLYYIGREQKIEGALPYISLKQFFDRIVK
jgi:protein-disulfide isomerase